MSTKSKKKSKTVEFLESITGGPLTLGNFIDAIREGEEWTKVEMASMLGVSKSYYSDLIADRKSVSPQKAAEWAETLGYSPEQFIQLALEGQLRKHDFHYKVALS